MCLESLVLKFICFFVKQMSKSPVIVRRLNKNPPCSRIARLTTIVELNELSQLIYCMSLQKSRVRTTVTTKTQTATWKLLETLIKCDVDSTDIRVEALVATSVYRASTNDNKNSKTRTFVPRRACARVCVSRPK